MSGRFLISGLLVLVLLAGAAGVGVIAYNYGVAQGLMQSGQIVAPEGGAVPYAYPYYGPFFFHRPFFGFGLLGCLFPLLFFFVVFGLLRALFWRGPWGWGRRGGWGHHGPWGKGVPPMFEEWHKRAHGEAPGPAPAPESPSPDS